MKPILCIEDSAEIQILVEGSLPDHHLICAASLSQARELLLKQSFALILLDLELPDGDGMKFLASLAGEIPEIRSTPIFILTANAETVNKVIAFSLGVDDFISKPFDPMEFRARIEAKIRKSEGSPARQDILKIKDLQIDLPKQRVSLVRGTHFETLSLTSIELKLLLTLARHPDRVFSRDQLLDQVWGSGFAVSDRTVDTHINHLRKKIADSAVQIQTVFNEGYRLLP